jgi:hypothetical protein
MCFLLFCTLSCMLSDRLERGSSCYKANDTVDTKLYTVLHHFALYLVIYSIRRGKFQINFEGVNEMYILQSFV